MTKPISIYIHIPFCDSKCYYCSFISFVQNDQIKEQYFNALRNEISAFQNDNYSVKTIYFGGGTPSYVDPKFIKQMLDEIKNKFKIDKKAEITIECNPNSVDASKLAFYKEIGVNRISFGVQSFNKRSLEFVGRVNDKVTLKNYKKQALDIIRKAKEVGFDNISADFILGLPYQSKCQLKRFIKELRKHICHFSCYMLTVEEGTKLTKLLPNGISEERLSKEYEFAVKVLKKLGFERYEISNFAKKGFESKHNKVYWEMGEYLGFGVSAHSFYDSKRIANIDNLKEYNEFYTYHSKQMEKSKSIKGVEKLSTEQLAEETIMLALRTRQGLDLVKFKNDFYDLENKKKSELARLLNSGFIEFKNNFLSLSNKGYLVANKIILELI